MTANQHDGARRRATRTGGVLGIFLGASLAIAWLAGALAPPAAADHGGSHAARGYFLADSGGHMTRFGDAMDTGSLLGSTLRAPIVDGDTTPSGNGSVLVASDGGVFAFGDAPFLGSMAGTPLVAPIVTIEMTPTGRGYLMAAADGGVFAFGDARFRGSLGGLRLNQPIVDMALNATNDGYFLAAADGGVFAFGGARFRGSMGGRPLNKPVVGILADEVSGYGLVASDGGVFAFGRFVYRGSLGSLTLRAPIVDAVMSSTGDGYNMVASDGGVFAFGDAPFAGSLARLALPRPIVTILGLGNQPPVATDDAYTATEDTVLTRNAATGVLANDDDDDGDTITAAVATGPTKGTLVLNADGSFTYTPNANANGADSFTYTASDPHGKRDTGTVSITVNAVNDAPVAVNDAGTTNEDTPLVVPAPGVLANDTDVEGSPLTGTVVANPTKGTLVLNGNGSFTYTPNANANGADSFTYRANDGTANSNVATVSLTVNALNDAPVAVNDAATTSEDTPLVVAAPGVLANDSDVEGSPLTATVVANPTKGTVTLNGNGSFTYTPNAHANGADSFTYRANDGTANSNVATVTLTVNAVNDAPLAVDEAFATNEDTALNGNVLANDSDVDGNTLSATVLDEPDHGTLTLASNGGFTYTPTAHYHGPDAFTYTVSDGVGGTDTGAVTLTVNPVNDAPVAVNDAATTSEDTPLVVAAPGVLANDSDVEGGALTAVVVAGPTKGTLTLNANGSFTYTPNANANGADSFTYKANDGSADSNVATVGLTVNAVNDVPVAVNDSYTTNEDAPLVVSAPGVLGNDADADGNPLTAVLVSGPTKGTLTLNADGSFTYTPNAHYNGGDSFTYRASDGTAQSSVVTVALTVNAVNDAPTAANDAYNTDEDTPLVVAAPGVLANDTDVEGASLTAALETAPSNGTLTLGANGSFTYTPAANYTGADSFTYRASDGTAQSNLATVSFTVGAVNDAPVAANDSYSTDEDLPLNVVAPGVLANDTDADGNSLTAVLVAGPTKGALTLNANGSFTYAPNANTNGADSFTYRAGDGAADSNTATVTITVSAVNDAPVAVDDAYSTDEDTPLNVTAPGVLANDTDVEGPLSATSFGDAVNGTITGNADGSFTFTPTANFSGTASFGYTVSDGTVTDTGAVTITVSPVNDAPVATNDGYSTDEDLPLNVVAPAVLANDSDADGNSLTAVLVNGPSNGSLTLNANGSFSYAPNANYNGADSFTYKANDGTADSNTATVTITVNAVHDAPVAVDDGPYNSPQDQNLTLAAPGVLANDSDADGQSLTAGNASDPANGTVTLNPDGSFSYDPDAGFTGTDTFTYDVSDGTVTDAGLVTINVVPPNATPTADATSKTGNEDGGAITVTLTGHDADGDELAFSAGTATNGLVTVPSGSSCDANTPSTCTATVTYTPNADFNGSDSFTYTVNDGTIDSAEATVTMTIDAVNDEPSFTQGSNQSVNEDAGAQAVNGWATAISAGPADESGQTVTFTVTTDNDGMFSALPAVSSAGDLTYTPATNANGSATVSVTPVDDGGTANGGDDTGATETFTITVTPVNDAPSFTKGSDQTVNEDAGAQSVSNWATAISKGPADESGQSLSFTTSNDSNALFSVQPGVTPTGTLVYTAAPNAVGTAIITISLSDTGGTANGGDDTSDSQTFTITVTPVNDEPSFTGGADETVLEDAGARTAVGWASDRSAGPADEAGQTVTIERVGTTNDALFSVLPAVAANGDLTYTPAPDANGIATVTLRATDDGGTANGGDATGADVTFDITVTAVNDAPGFTKGANQTVNEDAGAQSFSGWATALSTGPANENTQTLSFEVTANDNGSLFASLPAVSSSGTLTFTSAPNKYGVANITIRAKDDGGTANGGVDVSPTQTFTITVNAVNDAPVAAAKSFTVQANMKISLGGLLTGATDPNDVAGDPTWSPTFTLGSITAGAGCIGCTISNVDNANGTFDFDPPAGGSGTYTVGYTVVDNGHPAPGVASAAQTITFTVNGPVIWFVDTGVAGGGTGRLSAPFNTLASATAAMAGNVNQRIFVRGGNVTGNVTLPTDGWLISEAATGANFDGVMGISPPAGTIARPAVNGAQRTLTGTVTLGTNSVVRGFDLTPSSGNQGLVASGKTGLTVNQLSVTTTSARAVNLSSSSGTFTLRKVQATGADRGISLTGVNTGIGSFTVTGDGSTPGSGGVITGSTATGTLDNGEGGIYLNDTKNVSLAWMTVSNGLGHGIHGVNVTTFSLSDSTVSGNGTDAVKDHSGIDFDNLLGTSSINRVTVFGSFEHNIQVINTSGTANLTVSNSMIRDNHVDFGGAGLYVNAMGSANVTFTSTSNAIERSNITGLQLFAHSTVKMTATITGGTYIDNSNGIDIANNGTGGMAFSVNGGTVDGCDGCGVGVNIFKGLTGTGTGANGLSGTVNGMTITTAGDTDSPGIWAHGGGGPGAVRLALTNNNISQAAFYGISVFGGATGAGSQTWDVSITGNSVSNIAGSFIEAIFVQSGTSSTDNIVTCAHLAGNTATSPDIGDIRVASRFAGTTLRLPGYTGPATDTAAVVEFLKAQNTVTDATATIASSGPGFAGGSACAAP